MAAVKSKTNLACDTCRQRKSRCDGIRPRCSHCKATGRECTYRPTPTSLETDASILSRLAVVESRLQSVEVGSRATSERAGSHAIGTPSELAAGPRKQRRPPSIAPDLHTASAYKMLHCWPRIRLNLTVPGIISTTYLADADAEDPVLLQTPTSDRDAPQVFLWQLVELLDGFYDSCVPGLPVYISELFDSCATLSRPYILDSLANLHPPDGEASSRNSAVAIDVHRLSVQHLLVLSLAKRSFSDPALLSDSAAPAAISAVFFTLALEKQWVLLSYPDEVRVPLVLLAAYCLFYYWARPFHALGLLQSIDPAMKCCSLRNPGDSLVLRYSKLHFILESDILTEIDGFPSKTSASMIGEFTERSVSSQPAEGDYDSPMNDGQENPTASAPAPEPGAAGDYIESHMWLRSHMNRILHLLYGTNKAYAQPHELADIVCSLSAELRHWYRSRPLEQQFVRDATTLSMDVPPASPRLREIAMRYFYSVFLIHRPVLYFFLHRDMEYSVRPPDNRDLLSGREPWILESCRDCIESTALLIHFSRPPGGENSSSSSSWGDVQALFAAYLVLLQARSAAAALKPIFRSVGDPDELLDCVERILEAMPLRSLGVRRGLAVLRDERRNFEVASPGYSIPSV